MTQTSKTALVVVDVQPTFMEGGGLPVPDGEAVVEVINRLMSRFDYVITTQDWHIDPGEHISNKPNFVDKWPAHGLANTPEAEVHPDLHRAFINFYVKKGQYGAAYSGFQGEIEDGRTLQELLWELGVERVFVCGLATDYCIKETALDAKRFGFSTTVLLAATRGVSDQSTEDAIRQMDQAGIELDRTSWNGF